jgi:hypothetical protein
VPSRPGVGAIDVHDHPLGIPLAIPFGVPATRGEERWPDSLRSALTPEEALESLGLVRDQAIEPTSVPLSLDDLALLLEALDSHKYWQIGDVLPRNDRMVWIPGDCVGSVDRYWEDEEPTEEQADAIDAVRRCRELAERLRVSSAGG